MKTADNKNTEETAPDDFHADNADNHKGHYKFEFAPKASTYIELTGWFENADKTVAADVRYYIHLGNFGKDLNHFSVERDHHYTYNVTINGVDDIVVEVEEKTKDYQEFFTVLEYMLGKNQRRSLEKKLLAIAEPSN